MNKIKRKYIFVFLSFFILGIAVGVLILLYLPKKPVLHPTVNVFGSPRSQTTQNFPTDRPEFTAVIGAIKPASLHQQSINVYQMGDAKRTPVFDRPFYADGFRGSELAYILASNSASILQSGSIGSIGCTVSVCNLLWNNFYTWDAKLHTFVLDNSSHKNEFQQLLVTYQEVDKKGCNIVGGTIFPEHEAQSFTEIHKKYPTASFYCSKSQGIVPSNLNFFLQAEKTLQKIVHGENIGSNEIRDIEM